VGRLDYYSEGLILLTTDGILANRIMSPKGHVEKVYVVKANGKLSPEQEESFRTGLVLDGRRTAPAGLKLIKNAVNPWYEVRLTEGRQNQIRLMFKTCGRLVEKLRRVKIGPLKLEGVAPGEWRYLSGDEVAKLRRALKLDDDAASRIE
jgi:23S rRNA pseudouridine2605 synthase